MDVWVLVVGDEVVGVYSTESKLEDARWAELSDAEYNQAREFRWTVDGSEVDA